MKFFHLIRMADNSRMSKMSSKEDECIFSWKLFTGWDYMIGSYVVRFFPTVLIDSNRL